MLILIVASGPDKGRIHELFEDKSVVVGSDSEQFKLSDHKASAQHARIWHEADQWMVEDCGSKHGTYCNRKKIDSKQALQDGDRIQIGTSVLVVARMSTERAERLALFGDPVDENAQPIPPKNGSRRPLAWAAAGAAAAAVVVGVNVATYLASTKQTQQLRDDLAAVTKSATTASADRLLAEVRNLDRTSALAAATPSAPSQNTEPLLQEILAAVQAQQDAKQNTDKTLAQLRDAVQAQLAKAQANPTDNTAQVTASLNQILAELRQRPTTDELLPKLQDAIAASDSATRKQIELVLAQLKQQPTQQQLAQHFAAMREEDARRAQALQAKVLARLDAATNIAEQFTELRKLVQKQADAVQTHLTDRLAQLDTAGDQATVLAAIAELKASLPADVSPKLDEALASIEELRQVQQVAQAQPAEQEQAHEQEQAQAQLAAELAGKLDEVRLTIQSQAAAVEARLTARLDQLRTLSGEHRTAAVAAINELKASLPADASPKLDALLAQLERQPSATEIAAAVQQAGTASDQQLLARLDAMGEQIAATAALPATADKLTQQQTQTAQMLTSILEQVQDQAAINALRKDVQQLAQAPGNKLQSQLERIAKAVAARDAVDARLAQIQDMLKALPTAQRDQQNDTQWQTSIEALDTALAQRAAQTDTLLSQLVELVKQQPTGQQLTQQLQTLREADAARAAALQASLLAKLESAHTIEQRLTQLANLLQQQAGATEDKLATLPTQENQQALLTAIQQLRQSMPTDTSSKLDTLLAKLESQQSLATALASLRDAVEQQPAVVADQLAGKLDTLTRSQDQQAVLSAIAELKTALPADASPKLDQVLAAVKAGEIRNHSLAQALADMRSRSATNIDEVRGLVRKEVQTALQNTQLSVGFNTGAAVSASPAQQQPVRSVLLPQQGAARMAGEPGEPILSETERAYKLAFETQQPVTIGGGIVNPTTGEVSQGRTLDPASARAAGIKNWRDWYLMDDYAERMRLQRQAMRHAGEPDAQVNNSPSLIRLPSRTSDEAQSHSEPARR